jgi:hypothetical protein
MLEFGDPYLLEEYTLDDLKRSPILVWVVHDTTDGQKRFLTPLLNSRNLTHEFNHAKILLTIEEIGGYAEASYNAEDGSIYSILVWDGENAVEVEDSDLPSPIRFRAVPEIEGVSDVTFLLDSKEDFYAYQKHSVER